MANREWREKHPGYQQHYMREWRKRNPNSVRETSLKKYGLTLTQEKILLSVQNNKCAICSTEFIKTPCVDHDHKTGRVRGLICSPCNKMIGFAKDSQHILQCGIDYLKRNQEEI